MPLPSSGAISFNAINVELGVSGTTQASLGQATYRTLAGVPSGAISLSNFYGKSNRVAITITLSSNQQNVNIFNLRGGSYVAGGSDITVNVNSGVVIGASSTGVYAMTISGFTSGDTIRLNNSGRITGCGGRGGNGGYGGEPPSVGQAGAVGGNALNITFPTTIFNSGNIWGGGGGGGGGGGTFQRLKYSPAYGVGGGGGGGGAGNSVGGGGTGAGGSSTGSNYNGFSGTLTSGGAGGGGYAVDGYEIGSYGGAGGGNGANGVVGGTGQLSLKASGGAGGLSGFYIVGNGNVTWGATGNRLGRVS
jgi:hypothetical protein